MTRVIEVVVDNRIRIRIADLSPEIAERIRNAFVHPNPAYGKRDDRPTFATWRHEGEWLSLPRGGMQRVRDALDVTYVTRDRRVWDNPEPGFPDHRRELWAHQERMLEIASAKQNVLLRAPTGSGKTTFANALLARLKRRSLIIVWTGNLLRQWVERAVDELGYAEKDVGIIGDGKRIVRPLTIGMQQTIVSRFAAGDTDMATDYDVVGCDEVQRFAAPTLFASVDPFAARYRFGVSADETRKDELEFLVYDLFGPPVTVVEEAALIELGHIVEVEVYATPTNFAAPWYRYRQDWNRLLEQMVGDEARNELALKIARQVVGQGEQVLLFTHRVEHARMLDAKLVGEGIRSGTLIGGVENATAFDRTKAGLKSGALRAGVGTYQAIAQGTDLPTIARGICVTPIANNRQQLGQVKGRICRSADGKAFGRLYVLWDKSVYGKRTIENLAKWQRVVRVWDGGGWQDAKAFLKNRQKSAV